MTVLETIRETAARYGVPPELAVEVARRESGFRQDARGRAGEVGIFQLMPGTAAELGVNPADTSQNIDGGVRYLAKMFSMFGDWRTALHAYNTGPGNVQRGKIPSSTKQYASGILARAGLPASGDLPAGPVVASSWPSVVPGSIPAVDPKKKVELAVGVILASALALLFFG